MHHKKTTRNAISVYGTQAGSRKGTARLSTMTRCRERSHGVTKACAINSSTGLGCDCRCSRGMRTAECGYKSAVIVGSADWQQTDFFYSEVEILRSQWIALKYCMQYDRLSQQ